MKKILLALSVILAAVAAASAAARPSARADWDDPFELKDIRGGFARLRTMADEEPAPAPAPEGPAQRLLDRKRSDLETLYRNSESGPVPDGKANGFAAISPGTAAGGASEALFRLFWHGKIFDRKNGALINRLTIGHVVKAKVFIGPSWLDGKPSVIIDYKGTSWIAGAVRDEIREVQPGVYLGFAYARSNDGDQPRADILFALDFTASLPDKPKAP